MRWDKSVDQDITLPGERNWMILALNREEWKKFLKKAGVHIGLSSCCCWWWWCYNGLNNRGSIPSKCWDSPSLRPDRLRVREGSYPTDSAPPLEVRRPKRAYERTLIMQIRCLNKWSFIPFSIHIYNVLKHRNSFCSETVSLLWACNDYMHIRIWVFTKPLYQTTWIIYLRKTLVTDDCLEPS